MHSNKTANSDMTARGHQDRGHNKREQLLNALAASTLALHLAASAEAMSARTSTLAPLTLTLTLTPLVALSALLSLWVSRGVSRGGASAWRARPLLLSQGLLLGGLGLSALLWLTKRGLSALLQMTEALELIPHAAALLVLVSLGVSVLSARLLARPSEALLTRLPPPLALTLSLGVSAGALAFTLLPSLLTLFKDPPMLALELGAGLCFMSALLTARWRLPARLSGLLIASSPLVLWVGLSGAHLTTSTLLKLEQARGLSALVLTSAHALSGRDDDGSQALLERQDLPTPSTPSTPSLKVISPQHERHNLLLITIDALRADHVSWAHEGDEPRLDLTPNLNELTRSGLIFSHAYTPCANTRYAIPPLMSGRALPDLPLDWRGRYLVMSPPSPKQGARWEDHATLFERLRREGYQTSALTGSLLTEGMWYGLERGFERFVGDPQLSLRARSGAHLVERALNELNRLERDPTRPWALWLHALDPHEPYLPHQAHQYGSGDEARYQGEVAYTDAQLGRLLKALEQSGLRERTLIALTSDHGESFGEHGRRYHGKQLFEESVRVPLLISPPAPSPPQPLQNKRVPLLQSPAPSAPQPLSVWVREPVSTLDMSETVAELLGLPASSSRALRSHAPKLKGGEGPSPQPVFTYRVHNERPLLLELALIKGEHKLIYDPRRQRSQLYDLTRDPQEKHELSAAQPLVARAMLREAKAEARRFQRRLFEGLYERHVSLDEGALTKGEGLGGEVLSDELRLLSARAEVVELGGRRLREVRATLLVTAPLKDKLKGELKVSAQWRNRAGEPTRSLPLSPLAGLYPPQRWRVGEQVELISSERLKAREAHSVTLMIERGGERLLERPLTPR